MFSWLKWPYIITILTFAVISLGFFFAADNLASKGTSFIYLGLMFVAVYTAINLGIVTKAPSFFVLFFSTKNWWLGVLAVGLSFGGFYLFNMSEPAPHDQILALWAAVSVFGFILTALHIQALKNPK